MFKICASMQMQFSKESNVFMNSLTFSNKVNNVISNVIYVINFHTYFRKGLLWFRDKKFSNRIETLMLLKMIRTIYQELASGLGNMKHLLVIKPNNTKHIVMISRKKSTFDA